MEDTAWLSARVTQLVRGIAQMKCPPSMRPQFRELQDEVDYLNACQCLLVTLRDLLVILDPDFFAEPQMQQLCQVFLQLVIVQWERYNALKTASVHLEACCEAAGRAGSSAESAIDLD